MTWGNHNAIVAMTEKLAKREGFGAIIADGVKEAAGRIGKGATKYAIHVGGQEIPMHDPKLLPGFALAYITDATPGRHSQCGTEEKVTAEEYKKSNCLLHAYSSAGLCLFYYLMGEHDMTLDFLNAVTGHQYTIDEFTNVGERIANIRQAFNIRENVNPLQFRLPSRVIGEPPQTEGPNAGVTINVSSTVKEYLKAMDWDLTTGKPSKKKLLELGLEDVARTLWPE
jgi:aldehyde:ferredoxin oxidoreductase